MIIKSATRLALSAACVSAIAALATANAQPANTSGTASGSYWTSPGANGTAPGAYPPPETYTPQRAIPRKVNTSRRRPPTKAWAEPRW
jgi:hypothetical protein